VPVGETVFWEEGKGIWHLNCKPSTTSGRSAAPTTRRRMEVVVILTVIVVMSMLIGIIIAPYLGRMTSPSQSQIAQFQTSSSQVSATFVSSTSSSLLYSSSTSTSPQKPKWIGSDANVISYMDAASYVGQVKTVEGTIVYTYNSKGTIFLDFHDPYKGYFSAVIFASDAGNFKFDAASFYRNKEVRVTGTIQLYQGDPEIVVNSPSQIEVAYIGFNYP
jgi:DNA/RNA endonuclease YhcR with UshA esterase domain